MPACDICNDPPGPDAKRYTAKQLRTAVDTGYRPKIVIDRYLGTADILGLDLPASHWWDEWVSQVRRDRTDWVLCRSCWTGLDEHLRRPATSPSAHHRPQRTASPQPAASPQPRRRWRLFGRRDK